MNQREHGRQSRHKRVRKKLSGTPERPRLAVHRSARSLQAQVVDDFAQRTLISFSTLDKDFLKQAPKKLDKKGMAKNLGLFYAGKMKEKGISSISFDRGGYLYHGRVKALADGLREGGIQF
jgi:large subunit ribosomal protein L18